MTCHSGGTLEIYVEPYLPKPLLVLIGHGPVVDTLAALGRAVDYAVTMLDADPRALGGLALTPRASVVVATHGEVDEDMLERVLDTGAGYVSLVASRKRAAAVVESLRERGVPVALLGRLKAPAGLDIGAVAPAEIAVSILAEIIQLRRADKASAPEAPAGIAEEAIDPVCGMGVTVARARFRSDTPGGPVYFCAAGCKARFDAAPEQFGVRPRVTFGRAPTPPTDPRPR
jgi:xanthine dehydrogenase accessory factor